jgi:hypothetical protein
MLKGIHVARTRSALVAFAFVGACNPHPSAPAASASASASSNASIGEFELTENCHGPGPSRSVTVDSSSRTVRFTEGKNDPRTATLEAEKFATLESVLASSDFDTFMTEKPSGKLEEGEVVTCTLAVTTGGSRREHSWQSNDKVSAVSNRLADKLQTELYALEKETK